MPSLGGHRPYTKIGGLIEKNVLLIRKNMALF